MWIVLWQRVAKDGDHSRSIAHSDGLVALLQSKTERLHLPWLAGVRIMNTSFMKLPIKRQIEWFRDCVVFIGPSGGGSYIAMFMPFHCSFIQLSENVRDYGMDWQLFNSLPNLEAVYVRSDRDSGRSHTLQAVDGALRRWYAFQ
eukprot:SAG11_NODE_13417_length_656_cov_0.736086_1_plen_144_part_00